MDEVIRQPMLVHAFGWSASVWGGGRRLLVVLGESAVEPAGPYPASSVDPEPSA